MLCSLASTSLNRWGEYEVHHKDLVPYHHAAIQLANTFEGFYISHVFRLQNIKADALAALAATLALPADTSYHLRWPPVISSV